MVKEISEHNSSNLVQIMISLERIYMETKLVEYVICWHLLREDNQEQRLDWLKE